jgi:hypothetical protein
MRLIEAGAGSCLDRFIDYYGDYVTSHEAYDQDQALHQEVRNAARALSVHVAQRRAGLKPPDESLADPRPT